MSSTGAIAVATCSVVGMVVGFAHQALRAPSRPSGLTVAAATMAVTTVAIVAVPSTVVLVVATFFGGYALATFWNRVHARILRLRPGQTGTVSAVISTVECAAFGLPIAYGAVADRFGIGAGIMCYAATAVALALLVRHAPSETPSRPVRA